MEYINHVHNDHTPHGEERKIMDAWLMCVQAIYIDILHSKAQHLQFPDDELQSIRHRLINSGGRIFALHARLEQDPPPLGNESIVDAVGFTAAVMHDICDCRHDNHANEFYNLA